MYEERENRTDPLSYAISSILFIILAFFILANPNYIENLQTSTGTPFDTMWINNFQPLLALVWTFEVALGIAALGLILFLISFFRRV